MFSVHQTHSWWIECRGITGVALWDLSLKLNAALKSHGEFHRDWFTECCGQCTLSIYDPTKLGTIKRCEMIEDVAVKQFFGATSSWMEAVMMSSQWRERESVGSWLIWIHSFYLNLRSHSAFHSILRFNWNSDRFFKFRLSPKVGDTKSIVNSTESEVVEWFAIFLFVPWPRVIARVLSPN